ncbi:MAG: alanine--tRNA ligase [Candidatus Dormibacteraceae bacterium]
MNSSEIRQTFLDFFVQHDHRLIGHAPLRSENDPTLLYINAGMAPLKRYFTGEARPPAPDLCNVQPCIRTTDLEDVGDRHHLTYFDMLGSWSINHYYKERAIELAFELLVDRFGFPRERLYATVFAGNSELGLAPDEISAGIWESVGLKRDQIVALGMDNFWGPAGETGPCGPCTEVFFDTGEAFGPAYRPGGHFDSESRYIEIWNAGVFMELCKQGDGSYIKLPFHSVDTGSGLERMAMVLGGHDTVYETDLLKPITERIVELAGGQEELSEPSVRLLADHLRTSTMILAEGVHPSNLGQGYIPRRMIRKCVETVTRADQREFPFNEVIDTVIERYGPTYPHLIKNAEQIKALFSKERNEFGRVIDRGLGQLETMRERGELAISGKTAFSLFATYGMPVELVQDYVATHGGSLDRASFEQEFKRHQERSKAPVSLTEGRQGEWSTALERIETLTVEWPPTDFIGYQHRSAKAEIRLLLVDGQVAESATVGQAVEVVLDTTSFYPEGGGQVGDRGQLYSERGVIEVFDTRRTRSRVIVHRGEVRDGEISSGQPIRAEVARDHRQQTAANHTATHLLQAALRQVLGTHVRQAGSLVIAERLRFDFTHPRPVTPHELAEIERLVNREVLQDLTTDIRTMPYEQAMAEGVLTLPGENYGDQVRRVRFGEFSAELCGGIHVPHTAAIGLFRLVQESGVAAGVRRVVAITREAALERTAAREQILAMLAARLNTRVEELPARVDSLMAGGKQGSRSRSTSVSSDPVEIQTAADGTPYVASWHHGEAGELRQAAAMLAGQHHAVVALGAAEGEKVRLVVLVPERWRSRHNADRLLRELLPEIEGSGGGNAGLAQGGGRNPAAAEAMLHRFGAVLAGVGAGR